MVDEQQEVRRINWNEALTVSHVFKSFRMSIHFSKLVLALGAFLLIWAWGWVLDSVSGPVAGVYVPDKEMYTYATSSSVDFGKWREDQDKARRDKTVSLWKEATDRWAELDAFKALLRDELNKDAARADGNRHLEDHFSVLLADPNGKPKIDKEPSEDERKKKAKENWTAALDQAESTFDKEVHRIEELLGKCRAEDGAPKGIKNDKKLDTDDKREAASKQLDADLDAAERALTRRKIEIAKSLRDVRGATVFEAFGAYEGKCLENAVLAVRRLNFTGGLAEYRKALAGRSQILQTPGATAAALGFERTDPTPRDDPPGFAYWLLMGAHGIGWLVYQHWFYAILFLGGALCIWALFGGAIHRIAALHFAREEKISMGQALRFAASKFLSFLAAPLIPLAIVVFIGLLLAFGGLIFGSWGGGILMGILFPLALLGGLLIAFLLVGLGAGGGLMYPTIAVESSDAFDAMSRSYSYVFEKPWRAAFYALAALVYGVICYLFVRFFAMLLLSATRCFVGFGVIGGGQTISPHADKLDVLWPAPTFEQLLPPFHWQAMSGWEMIGGGLIWLWVFLIAGLVMAFLLSYFANATTVIYFLLRRKVDATDLDDVYVEEAEEEPIGPAAPAETTEAPGEAAPAEQQLAEGEPPAEEAEGGEEEAEEGAEEEAEEEAEEDTTSEESPPAQKKAARKARKPKRARKAKPAEDEEAEE